MLGTVAVSGASGRTGFRVAEEVIRSGGLARLLLRPGSMLPDSLGACEQHRLDLADEASLDLALRGVDSLVIATGARPSVDLTGPMRVDAWGVRRQVEVAFASEYPGWCWSAPSVPVAGSIHSTCSV